MACQCQSATMRAHDMLMESGEREDRAYEAAVRVFRHYHPKCSRVEAYGVVAEWLERRDRGEEPGDTQ